MSESIDDGGTAFPASYPNGGSACGMSLLDYFAGQALHALLSHSPWSHSGAAREAYGFANAMLNERERIMNGNEVTK